MTIFHGQSSNFYGGKSPRNRLPEFSSSSLPLRSFFGGAASGWPWLLVAWLLSSSGATFAFSGWQKCLLAPIMKQRNRCPVFSARLSGFYSRGSYYLVNKEILGPLLSFDHCPTIRDLWQSPTCFTKKRGSANWNDISSSLPCSDCCATVLGFLSARGRQDAGFGSLHFVTYIAGPVGQNCLESRLREAWGPGTAGASTTPQRAEKVRPQRKQQAGCGAGPWR